MKWSALPLLFALTIGTGMIVASFSRAPASQPDYPHGDLAEDCGTCHLSESWIPTEISPDFDHSRDRRGFALTGQHVNVECRQCHQSLEFNGAETDCVSCHLDVHRSELGTDCGRCHTSRSFIDNAGMIRLHLSTNFPLRGTHASVDCEDCHALSGAGTLQYVSTPTQCEACHVEQFFSATDPDHQAFGFSRDCEPCHSAQAWSRALFDHDQIPPGQDCAACHLDDYSATIAPDHQALALPQSCEDCHGTRSWIPASFDHALLGAGAQCATCHLIDYEATTDPDHAAAGLPQDCQSCHGTNAWVPADFLEHDALFFPIFSGKHKNKWITCDECHTVGNNFSQFSCIDCHKHDDRNDVGNDHNEVNGYIYESTACLACHPQGG